MHARTASKGHRTAHSNALGPVWELETADIHTHTPTHLVVVPFECADDLLELITDVQPVIRGWQNRGQVCKTTAQA